MSTAARAPATRVLGVDCATDPRNVGVAAADVTARGARVVAIAHGLDEPALDAWLASHARGPRVLVALDAPLGWPAPLGEALAGHEAGAVLRGTRDALFQRDTDRVVHRLTRRRPLDVGADRIARCAHAALALLDRLRAATGAAIPLAWTPGSPDGAACVEVYPAGTLARRGWPASGYKGADGRAARAAILARLAGAITLTPQVRATARVSDHALDALLCVLAGADFVRGDVIAPTPAELRVARREGWIWLGPRDENPA